LQETVERYDIIAGNLSDKFTLERVLVLTKGPDVSPALVGHNLAFLKFLSDFMQLYVLGKERKKVRL
jgi:hypothetical protein